MRLNGLSERVAGEHIEVPISSAHNALRVEVGSTRERLTEATESKGGRLAVVSSNKRQRHHSPDAWQNAQEYRSLQRRCGLAADGSAHSQAPTVEWNTPQGVNDEALQC